MKVKEYPVLLEAVESGVAYGVRRYYKHKDTCPTEEKLQEMMTTISGAVTNEILSWFDIEVPEHVD